MLYPTIAELQGPSHGPADKGSDSQWECVLRGGSITSVWIDCGARIILDVDMISEVTVLDGSLFRNSIDPSPSGIIA